MTQLRFIPVWMNIFLEIKLRIEKVNRSILTLVILLSLSNRGNLYSQDNYFYEYNKNVTRSGPEKIYLHIDRNFYTVKDDIWFKIYLLEGKTQVPITGVNTVYVDLVSPGGEVLFHKPFFVQNGTGNGSFTIGDSLRTGIYIIYAYTNYLRNFGTETFFKKEISISQILINADKQIIIEESITSDNKEIPRPGINLQFMPEGGYLSNNLDNVLAFKITEGNGKGINKRGVLKDQNGHLIDSLYCNHLGMGKINLKVQPDLKYYVILNDFPTDTFPLPLSYDRPQLKYTGIADNTAQFRISDMSKNYDEKVYYFTVKAKGSLTFYIKMSLKKTTGKININLKNFRPGLNQAILLDSNFVPLAERLFFIPGTPQVAMNVQLAKETFNTREKTEVRLQILDEPDKAIGGSFSLSVVNLDQIGASSISSDNIISYLDLTSEIRGFIEEPGHYLSEPYNSVKDELDILLLTQGWTKYVWDEKFLSSLPPFRFVKETGLTISGHAQKLYVRRPLEEGKIILLVPGENIISETSTDSTGYFHFDNLILFDSVKIAVQSRNKNNKANTRLIDANSIITAAPIFPEQDTFSLGNADIESYIKSAYPRYISNSYFNFDKSTRLIPEVTIVKKREKEDDGHFRRYGTSLSANNVIDMDNYESMAYSDIFSFLQGLVPGLYIEGNQMYIRRATRPPLILLDGDEIEMELVRHISLREVDKIEILKDASSTAVYGVQGGNGVVAIYTKRGEIGYYEPPVLFDIIAKSIEGYAKAKEFYVPNYENPETNKGVTDSRATVFWIPNLIPDSNGTCTISFFNSDDEGRIAIISEGILNNGKAAVAKAFYQVKREKN